MLKKSFSEGLLNFTKTAGTEAAKKLFHSSPQKENTPTSKVTTASQIIDIVTKPYNWDAIHQNAYETSKFVKTVAKSGVISLTEFVLVPVASSAITFSIAGVGGASLVYTTSKFITGAHGLYRISKCIIESEETNEK